MSDDKTWRKLAEEEAKRTKSSFDPNEVAKKLWEEAG